VRIVLVGGIFGMDADFRSLNLQETTETLLAEGLRERGHDVRVLGHRDPLEVRGADLVHVHHLATACVKLAVRHRGVPLVFTRHATKALPVHHQLVLRATYRRATAVVALSEFEAASVRRVAGDKVTRIYNGVRPDLFRPTVRNSPRAGEPWRLLMVGQLVELKRSHLALHLVRRLLDRGIAAELRVVHHRDTLLPGLTAQRSALGLEDAVSFVGARSRSDLGNEMRDAHVLVHPSRTEALPTVITEAAFTGLPVVAFRVGGIAEQVPDPHVLPAVHDVEAFHSRVEETITRYSATTQLYREHVDSAVERFSVDRMISEHERLYCDILEARR
jgi:glycosyltransferase involved in cell wall biosynthesis